MVAVEGWLAHAAERDHVEGRVGREQPIGQLAQQLFGGDIRLALSGEGAGDAHLAVQAVKGADLGAQQVQAKGRAQTAGTHRPENQGLGINGHGGTYLIAA